MSDRAELERRMANELERMLLGRIEINRNNARAAELAGDHITRIVSSARASAFELALDDLRRILVGA